MKEEEQEKEAEKVEEEEKKAEEVEEEKGGRRGRGVIGIDNEEEQGRRRRIKAKEMEEHLS